jgi:ketoreductase RED1
LIAEDFDNPDRIIVGHPFNPPALMPLVEVVPGNKTSDDTVT